MVHRLSQWSKTSHFSVSCYMQSWFMKHGSMNPSNIKVTHQLLSGLHGGKGGGISRFNHGKTLQDLHDKIPTCQWNYILSTPRTSRRLSRLKSRPIQVNTEYVTSTALVSLFHLPLAHPAIECSDRLTKPIQTFKFSPPTCRYSPFFFTRNWSHIATHYCRCCCSSSCWCDALQKSLRLRRFKSDWDKLWQYCSSSKYAYVSIDQVRFLRWRHTFKMAVRTSFQARRTVLPSDECTCSVRPTHMQQRTWMLVSHDWVD